MCTADAGSLVMMVTGSLAKPVRTDVSGAKTPGVGWLN